MLQYHSNIGTGGNNQREGVKRKERGGKGKGRKKRGVEKGESVKIRGMAPWLLGVKRPMEQAREHLNT